jgi:hypothetical protein
MVAGNHQVIFKEVDEAVHAIDVLRGFGVEEENIEVVSGLPFSHHMLGRAEPKSRLVYYALAGAISGFIFSILLTFGTPLLYPVRVGGFPLISVPPSIILMFELTMLGLMSFTFFGVILENRFPRYTPMEYSRKISNGYISILFRVPEEKEAEIMTRLEHLGGEDIGKAEVLK